MYLPPLPVGVTSVTGIRLYAAKDRTGVPQEPPVSLVDGRWYIDTLNVADGRWWATVDATQGATPYAYPLRDPVDLPEDDRLIVSPEALAVSMRIPLPIDDDSREILTSAILAAQSDVVAYLGRPILPQQYVEKGVWPNGDEWALCIPDNDPLVKVISAVPEDDYGTYTVTYIAGIDAKTGAEYEPIRRYVLAHAANLPESLRLWRFIVKPKGAIKSSSTEGQSVSYETPTLGGGGAAGSGSPGALPTLSSLDKWRVAGRRVWQGRTHFGERYGV